MGSLLCSHIRSEHVQLGLYVSHEIIVDSVALGDYFRSA